MTGCACEGQANYFDGEKCIRCRRVEQLEQDLKSAKTQCALLSTAVLPLVKIANFYDQNRLDDEARKYWGANDEHVNETLPDEIELYTGRGGSPLLNLQHCLDAREAIYGGKKEETK